MEKTFEALRQKHPGYEVADFRMTLDFRSTVTVEMSKFDAMLAEAICNAKRVDLRQEFSS